MAMGQLVFLGGSLSSSFGSTYLTEVGTNFYLDSGGGVGPSLKLAGANVVAGQFGGWGFIGAEATGGGYEVALKLAGAQQYALWNTDNNGNYLSGGTILAATDPTLKSAEITLHQDLNGDGTIGIPGTGTSSTSGVVVSIGLTPVVAASAAAATPAAPGSLNVGVVFGSAVPALSESSLGGDGHPVASVQSPSPALSHDFHLV